MGIKRIVDTAFWTDEKTVELFSPEDRLFFLYLLTNPHTTQLGVYQVAPRTMAFETGYEVNTIKVLLDRFANKYHLIRRNPETGEIAIRNYLRHSIVKGGKPVLDLLNREAEQVKDKKLIEYVCRAAVGSTNDTVRSFIHSYINDNDNDNDNEDSWPNRGRIVDDSSETAQNAEKVYTDLKDTILSEKENADKVCEWCGCKTTVLHAHHYPVPKRLGGTEVVHICSNCHAEFHSREGKEFSGRDSDLKEPKQIRHKYGEYKNVLLSDEDLEKLKAQFPADWKDRIENLSEYIAKTGKSYKSHLATIRSWARKDKENGDIRKPAAGPAGTTGAANEWAYLDNLI